MTTYPSVTGVLAPPCPSGRPTGGPINPSTQKMPSTLQALLRPLDCSGGRAHVQEVVADDRHLPRMVELGAVVLQPAVGLAVANGLGCRQARRRRVGR